MLLGLSTPILYDRTKVGPVELATLSFGQRFKITPIQLITTVSGLVNEGKLMKPQVVLKEEDTNTGSQKNIGS